MDWGTFLRREWGAVLFVVTVIIGLVAVPVALYVNGQKATAPVSASTATPIPSPSAASGPRVATSAAVATPTPSPTH